MGMISICDVAVGAADAKFGFTEARLGLLPATISPYVVARMGEGMARRVFMSARIFWADEARELGLLARVVPAEELDAAVEAEVKPYLSCAPGAVAASKRLTRLLGRPAGRRSHGAHCRRPGRRLGDGRGPGGREGVLRQGEAELDFVRQSPSPAFPQRAKMRQAQSRRGGGTGVASWQLSHRRGQT